MVLAFGLVKRIRSSMRINKKGSSSKKKGSLVDENIEGSNGTGAQKNADRNHAENSNSVQDTRSSLVLSDDSSDANVEAWIFLNYQGETKRALFSYDEIRTVEDLRQLFAKVFQLDTLNPGYLHNPQVKIYAQDPNRPDVFYELESIKDIKPKILLKLHEQVKPAFALPGSLSTTNQNSTQSLTRLTSLVENQQPQQQQHRSPSSMMNYYHSEPETQSTAFCRVPKFPANVSTGNTSLSYNGHNNNNDYSPSRSSSAQNATGLGGYQQQPKYHYGTLDSYYRNNSERARLNSNPVEPPAKPQRYAGGALSPTGHLVDYNRTPRPNDRVHHIKTNSESDKDANGMGGRNYHNYDDHMLYVGSDRSSNTSSRSGSVTPIVDEEARARMLNMEKQLANLSNLVHSALMTKGVSDTVYKDIELLRREILGPSGPSSSLSRDDSSDAGSVSRFSDLSSEKGSYTIGTTDNFYATDFNQIRLDPATRNALKNLKKRTSEVNVELKCLRRMVQVNSQTARDVLKDAFDRIRVILNTNQHLHIFAAQAQHQNLAESNPLLSDRSWINQEEDKHKNMLINIDHDLSNFEKQVEEIREKVVNGQKKLKISEVEQFTESLTNIIRAAANLKSQFPQLQERLKQVMSSEMEKVVREEKFLKEEPYKLDHALKRCKKLTGTIITMKKLAMVQDPTGNSGQNSQLNSPTSEENKATSKFTSESTNQIMGAKQMAASRAPTAVEYGYKPSNPSFLKLNSSFDEKPMVGKMNNLSPKSTSSTNSGSGNGDKSSPSPEPSKVLDCLLEELTNVANSTKPLEKRVGFAEKSKEGSVNLGNPDGSTDTIKRSPKTAGAGQAAANSPSLPNPLTSISANSNINYMDSGKTGLLKNTNHHNLDNHKNPLNANNGGAYDENMNPTNQHHVLLSKRVELPAFSKPYVPPPPTASSSSGLRSTPLYVENLAAARSMTNSPKPNWPLSYSGAREGGYDRSRSNTPLSSASEPTSFEKAVAHHQHASATFGSAPAPPPPPQRSSSRLVTSSALYKNAMGTSGPSSASVGGGIYSVTGGVNSGRQNLLAPAPMIQTNAVDIENDYQHHHQSQQQQSTSRNSNSSTIKSASSNESVNSQDAIFLSQISPFKKPPPPPPPRNKQEMLEQRQHELMTKQLRYQLDNNSSQTDPSSSSSVKQLQKPNGYVLNPNSPFS